MTRTQAQQGPTAPWSRPRRAAPDRGSATRSMIGSGRARGRGRGPDGSKAEPAQGIKPPAVQWDGACEPDLASVLADPIVALVMARDGLSALEVSSIVGRARARLIAAPDTTADTIMDTTGDTTGDTADASVQAVRQG